MRLRKIITKKERAVVDQIIASVISLLAMIILVSISLNVFKDLNNKNKMDNLARRFMLDVETIGYTGILDYETENAPEKYYKHLEEIFENELSIPDDKEVTVTIKFDGTDYNDIKSNETEYVSYGDLVEIEITGKILSHVHSWGISGMFNIGNESDDGWIPFSKTLASTAKR